MEDAECRDFIVHDDGSIVEDGTTEADAEKFAEECIDDWRDQAFEGWPEEVRNTYVALITHRTEMVNDRDVTEDDHVGPDCTRVCDYELQPTAEWSRIQQLMKEHEWMKRVLCHAGTVFERDGQLCRTYGENHDQVQAIADEDLEPFTTAVGCSINLAIKAYDNLAAELETLKAGLPTNADEDVPTIDSNQFMIDDEGELVEFIVDMMHKESGEIYLHGRTVGEKFGIVTPLISQCHSSADTCRAANEVEEAKTLSLPEEGTT